MKHRYFDTASLRAASKTLRRSMCAALLALPFAACGSCSGSVAPGTTAQTQAPSASSARRLELPHPPAALADQQEQVAYITEHYWDRFDFADTGWIADTAALEQAFANYLSLLPMLPAERAAKVQRTLIDSASRCTPMFERFTDMQEHYLYDPNSPMRNEGLYIPVLKAVIALPALDDAYKIRPRAQLDMALKNRPGMVAADFAYTTPEGRTSRLSSIKGDYTVLLFYNPGCPDCARVEEHIMQSAEFTSWIASGAVKMLAVYTEDDLGLWQNHRYYLPRTWTVAYDKGQRITGKSLYDLRAIPSLYLLDAKKRVILKDAPVEQIEAWLAMSQKPSAER